MDISETSAPAEGGKKIIILCERVARDDIKVETSLAANYVTNFATSGQIL